MNKSYCTASVCVGVWIAQFRERNRIVGLKNWKWPGISLAYGYFTHLFLTTIDLLTLKKTSIVFSLTSSRSSLSLKIDSAQREGNKSHSNPLSRAINRINCNFYRQHRSSINGHKTFINEYHAQRTTHLSELFAQINPPKCTPTRINEPLRVSRRICRPRSSSIPSQKRPSPICTPIHAYSCTQSSPH